MRKAHAIRLRRALVIALCSLALTSCLPLTGCFGMSEPPQATAYVNDDPIIEDEVTEFIEGFRRKNAQYESDESWAELLTSNGYTSESLRSYVIQTVFIPQKLILQECEKRDIEVSDVELDDVIEREKSYYEQRYGENSWDSVLASYGYDEESWRENEHARLLEEQLRNEVIGEVAPTEAEVQALANETASAYNGKSSYYIAFPSQAQAQSARDALGSPAGVSLEEFSRLGDEVSAGWNSLPANRDSMSAEYVQALNGLNAGDVSAPVQSGDEWLLVYCDAAFNVGAGGESVVLDSIPEEIYAQLVSDAAELKADALFDEWLAALADESAIIIEPMPDGLPYDVDSTIVE